jgi:murein DD-endopeptidase MepM/ murein hydrolase activator NlpD
MKFATKKYSSNNYFFKAFLLGSFVVSAAILTAYSTAHAGIFSFISDLVTSQEVSAKVEPAASRINSQTISLLQSAVNVDPNPHKSGDLTPVSNGALVADLAVADAANGTDELNSEISLYVVREGDNLSTIAEMFDVSVNTIMWANDISRASSIRTGQTLIILPVSGLKYTIKKGDTIRGIVSSYKADLDEVLNYNGMSINSTLVIGETIIIPDAEIQTVVATRNVIRDNIAHNTGGPSYSGYYIRPINGGVRSQGLHGYNAVDLAAPIGTTIYASASGRVIASVSGGWNGGYGSYIIISHSNNTQTLYAHTSRNFVALGQLVEQGQKIAAIGTTGKSTGPHVHFEIRGAKNPF